MRKPIVPAMAAALLLAGCAKEFPETPWSPAESSQLQALAAQNDADSRVELGRLNFLHNHIDEADALLDQAVKENPQDMEAKAWHAANDCKIAGRAGPWLMGFDKLYGVWACLSELKDAAAAAPDNFTVAMIQLNTDAEVNMFGSMERAVTTRDRLRKQIDARPDAYTPSAKTAFFEGAARLEELRGDLPAASENLRRVVALNADADSVARAEAGLRQLAAAKP